MINRDPNVQQSVASQQPTQFQNIAGPVQPFYGNPAGQPLYYVPGYPYPRQEYVQDPVKMAYANLPTQPYPTAFTPQFYGGNLLFTPQQVSAISVVLTCMQFLHAADVTNISQPC